MSWLWATATEGCSASVALHAPVDEGCVAFVNGGTETELWGRTYRAGPDVDRLAAAEYLAMAHASVAAADPSDSSTITVIGQGLLAHLINDLLPKGAPTDPNIVIDTTGSPDHIKQAIATLPRLGHLVLAAPPRTADIDLATYRDLHVRALTVTGVGWTSGPTDEVVTDAAIDAALERVVRFVAGHPTQAGAWYLVQGRKPA
jgi:threonine dehydrogenase-like Zn-dependent dehydrogenase